MSAFVFVLSVVLFMAFAATVASRSTTQVERHSVIGLASVAASLQIAGVMPRLAVSYRSSTHLTGDTQRLFLDLGRVTNFSSDLVIAAYLVVASVALVRAAAGFRVWSYVGYVGAAAAVAAAATISDGPGLLALLALVVWLIAASVTIARGVPSAAD